MNLNMSKLVSTMGALGALNLSAVDRVPIYFTNVPLATVFMAFVGSALFHAWDDSVRDMPRKKMYVSVLFFTMLSTTCVAVLPSMMGWEWYSTKLEGSLAFLFSVGAPHLIPIVKTLLPELARKWFRLGDHNRKEVPKDKQDESI